MPLLTGTMKTETGKVATGNFYISIIILNLINFYHHFYLLFLFNISFLGKFKEDVMNRLKIPDFLTKTLPQKLVKNNVGVLYRI